MDPNATLEQIRDLYTNLVDLLDEEYAVGRGKFGDDAIRLAELVEALDEWLSNGGFLPKAWAIDPERR